MRVLMLAILLVSGVASAAPVYKYSYQGNPFTAFAGSTTQQDYAGLIALSGYFLVEEQLAANFAGVIEVDDFVFTDGYEVFDLSMAASETRFLIQTDADGDIERWKIDIRESSGGGYTDVFLTYKPLTEGGEIGGSFFDNSRNGAEVLSSPGLWGTAVVPIPAAVWLFGSALVGLGWLREARS
jgi:hypothetical protein